MSAYLKSHCKARINGIYISQCGHKTNRKKETKRSLQRPSEADNTKKKNKNKKNQSISADLGVTTFLILVCHAN